MNYNSLFNVLYSTEISEATKADIISRLNQPIQESTVDNPLMETYMELLDTLVFSTASEALIYNIIDETFSKLDEDFINEVSDEWIKRKTEAGLKSRESAYKEASKGIKGGAVGLSQINKYDKASQRLKKGKEQAAKHGVTTGGVNKLKSAVGKVKNWAASVDKGPDYVGLARAIGKKASQDNIQMGDVGKTTRATNPNNGRKERLEKAKEKAKGTTIPSGETIEMGNSKINKVNKAKEKAKGTTIPSGETIEMGNSDISKRKERLEKAKEKAKGTTIPSGETIEMGTSKKKRNQKLNKEKEVKAETPQEEPKKEENKPRRGRRKKQQETSAEGEQLKIDSIPTEDKEKPQEDKHKEVSNNETPQEEPKKEEVKSEKPQEEDKPKPSSVYIKNGQSNIKKPETPKWSKNAYMNKLMREQEQEQKGYKSTLANYKERRDKMTSKPGYDPKELEDLDKRIAALEKKITNEALSDLALVLACTNISENCFLEVMEMAGANKANAEKVKDRYEQNLTVALDDMNKGLEKEGKLDPEKLKKAEELARKKEHFEEMFKHKFSDEK